jgi:hypothetical protein
MVSGLWFLAIDPSQNPKGTFPIGWIEGVYPPEWYFSTSHEAPILFILNQGLERDVADPKQTLMMR